MRGSSCLRIDARVDFATIIGVLLAAVAVLGTNALEGGQLASLLQPSAALIVLGGTVGAIAIQYPAAALGRAAIAVGDLVRRVPDRTEETLQLLLVMADHVRRRGVRSLVGVAESLEDPTLRRATELVARGTPADTVREVLEIEIERAEAHDDEAARLFDSGGGYAPTMGILGAVLGLIQVMDNLRDPSRLGSGIAIAFVATVYGLALANLVLLPIAGRLRERARARVEQLELVLEGASALAQGDAPELLAEKLRPFAGGGAQDAARVRSRRAASAGGPR